MGDAFPLAAVSVCASRLGVIKQVDLGTSVRHVC